MNWLFGSCCKEPLKVTGVGNIRVPALILLAIVFLTLAISGPAVQRTRPSNPRAPLLSLYAAPCDTSDVLKVLGKSGLRIPNRHDPHADVHFLWERIAACKSIIKDYIANLPPTNPGIAHSPPGLPALAPPQPTTTSPPGCSSSVPSNTLTKTPSCDVLGLYSALTYWRREG